MAEINIEIEEIAEKVNALRKAILDEIANVLPAIIDTLICTRLPMCSRALMSAQKEDENYGN